MSVQATDTSVRASIVVEVRDAVGSPDGWPEGLRRFAERLAA